MAKPFNEHLRIRLQIWFGAVRIAAGAEFIGSYIEALIRCFDDGMTPANAIKRIKVPAHMPKLPLAKDSAK